MMFNVVAKQCVAVFHHPCLLSSPSLFTFTATDSMSPCCFWIYLPCLIHIGRILQYVTFVTGLSHFPHWLMVVKLIQITFDSTSFLSMSKWSVVFVRCI